MQDENFEELISLPVGTKTSRLDAMKKDEKESSDIPLAPILAFEEKGTLGSLPQVDNVQTHQTAGKSALNLFKPLVSNWCEVFIWNESSKCLDPVYLLSAR